MTSSSSDLDFRAAVLGRKSEKERRWCESTISSPDSVESSVGCFRRCLLPWSHRVPSPRLSSGLLPSVWQLPPWSKWRAQQERRARRSFYWTAASPMLIVPHSQTASRIRLASSRPWQRRVAAAAQVASTIGWQEVRTRRSGAIGRSPSPSSFLSPAGSPGSGGPLL